MIVVKVVKIIIINKKKRKYHIFLSVASTMNGKEEWANGRTRREYVEVQKP